MMAWSDCPGVSSEADWARAESLCHEAYDAALGVAAHDSAVAWALAEHAAGEARLDARALARKSAMAASLARAAQDVARREIEVSP